MRSDGGGGGFGWLEKRKWVGGKEEQAERNGKKRPERRSDSPRQPIQAEQETFLYHKNAS